MEIEIEIGLQNMSITDSIYLSIITERLVVSCHQIVSNNQKNESQYHNQVKLELN